MSTATHNPTMPVDLQQALHNFSLMSGQSPAAITETALRDYLTWRAPQLLDLQEAIAAADREEFVSDEEANTFFAKYDA